MDQQVQQMLEQMPPEVLLAIIQVILEARPVVEALLQLPPEQLQQLAQEIQGGAQGQQNLYG